MLIATLLITLVTTQIISADGDPPILEEVVFPDAGGPYEAYVNECILFDATGTESEIDILGYIWDFGDGHIDGCVNPKIHHKYSEAGTYDVTLYVMTEYGSISDSTTATITHRAERIQSTVNKCCSCVYKSNILDVSK